MKKDRSFPMFCFVILENEVEPRKSKYGFRPPPEFTGRLAFLEFSGAIRRQETRKILDMYYEDHH